MGKKKVYELAKELNVDNKKIIEVAQSLGINVKTHLSGIDEAGVNKIKESMKSNKKNEVKTTGQVIIRREVIVDDEAKNMSNKAKNVKSDIGVTQRRTNKNFNIVYREKPTKPMTVSELFGLKPKKASSEKENKKQKVEENTAASEAIESKNVVQNTPKETTVISNESNENKSSKQEEKFQNNSVEVKANKEFDKKESNNFDNRQNYSNRSQNGYSKKNYDNRNSNFNRNDDRGYSRDSGKNSYSRSGQGSGFDRNSRNGARNDRMSSKGNFRRDSQGFNSRNVGNSFNKDSKKFDGRKNSDSRSFARKNDQVEENEFMEEKSQRDYSSKFIDKQKANRNFEEKKKTSRSRKFEEDFDEDKLRDLKQTDKLSNMFDTQEDGGMLDYYDLSTARGKRGKKNNKKKEERNKQKIFELKEITIPAQISVKDLATELKKTSAEVLKQLINLGIMANLNETLDFDTAYLVADSFGVTAKKKEEVKDEDILFDDSVDEEKDLVPRPPVVVVMGHVDHGKTSLLDAIRKTNVIGGEAGGITQHIGAYKVNINGREITFLDTPGHEAFTSMRARGAQITDIAILVVAADDGVMPQTIEAINHAKAAGIPIIVAVNKIDLPNANVEKVKQELMKYELVPEEWGGDTIYVPISAKNNINIDKLLEMVLLEADMLNLRANPNRQSKGTVIEARLDKAKGPIASVLVQRGTLNVGDTVIVGTSIGNIRTMKNDKGKNVKLAGPSTPVEITGLKEVPEAGDIFYEVKNEKVAKHLIEKRKLEEREKSIANTDVVTLDNLFEKMENEKLKVFNVIVKTDVQGTAEAMKSSLEKLSNDEVKVKVLHSSAGGVSESDVELAKAANAMIIAFNVRPVGNAKKLAEKEGVEIKQYSVIYQAIEDVQNAMKGMLAPKFKETNIGNAEVRQVFKVSNVGTIAGCYVTDGKVARNAGVRVIRDGVVIHEGKLISLKRFKDDAKEVSNGFECGMQIENYDDIQVGDTIEAYTQEQIDA